MAYDKEGERFENRENMMVFVLCCYDRILETGQFIKKRSFGPGSGWFSQSNAYCISMRNKVQIPSTHVNKQPDVTVSACLGAGERKTDLCSSLASQARKTSDL